MRIIHTSDWHLGHSLHGIPRRFEHERFLTWLQGQLHTQAADALIVAGDIFDCANPPASALAQFYRFLVETRQRLPNLNIVLIGGNHDSAAVLDAPRPLLNALNIHLVGGLGPLDELDGEDPDRMESRLLIPLKDYKGAVQAWCLAVPFLRATDLPPVGAVEGDSGGAEDPLIEAVRRVYDRLIRLAQRKRAPGQGLIVTGHCYMVGGQLSELSERKVLGGNQHALPAEIFPPEVSYAALGHLHLAQRVGRQEHIRYSGSPLPLAMDEVDYPHQVLRVDLDGEGLKAVEPIPVPRAVELLRCPAHGHSPLEQVIAELRALNLPHRADPAEYPFLEARVMLDAPRPGLRQAIDEAIADQAVRLVRINIRYAGDGGGLTGTGPERRLDALTPEQVFARCHERRYGREPAEDLAALFRDLLASVQEDA